MTTPLTKIPARYPDLTGTLPAQALPAEAVQTSGAQTIAGVKTHTDDVVLSSKKLTATHPTLDTIGASFLSFDPQSAPAWQIGGQRLVDLGPDNRNYVVIGMGPNLSGGNLPTDPTQTMTRYAWEYNYWNSVGIGYGPEYTHEFHLPSVVFPGNVEIRPLSILVGDTSHRAIVGLATSNLQLTDETGLHSKGGYLFDGTTASFSLIYNHGTGPDGTIFAYSAGTASDVFGFGRGSVQTTTVLNGSAIDEQLRLGGVTKFHRTLDAGNGGQLTYYGPGGLYQLDWTAGGVNQRWLSQRQKIGGFGVQTAQAQVIPDATTTIGLALKLNASQTEDAVKILDGSNATIFRVDSLGGLAIGGGALIKKVLTATGALNFTSIAAGATGEATLSVTGAASGDAVLITPPATLEAGLVVAGGRVTAADTITIRLGNVTAGVIDPASATYRATVIKF